MTRTVAVFLHPKKREALVGAAQFIEALSELGIETRMRPGDMERMNGHSCRSKVGVLDDDSPAELTVVFGGDGSILRAAAWALPRDVPVLGVNLGHVGFLAELEPSDIEKLPMAVAEQRYKVEHRLALEIVVHHGEEERWRAHAVNEVSLEKLARERMLTVLVSVDERPLSRWGCDGVLVSTPTGSTAYGFSAGGPVIWPDVQAMLVVPLSAHALFNRPMVLSPESTVHFDLPEEGPYGVLWCDGRTSHDLAPGERVTVTSHEKSLKIARLSEQPFTTRLVKKFALPVEGWGRQ